MRFILIILFLVFSIILSAQEKENKSISSIDLYYGTRPFFGTFYNQLNSVTKFNFDSPIRTIGLGTSGQFIVNRGSDYFGHFIYNHIIPESIHIQDTLKGKITGFVFSWAFGGAYMSEQGNFALYIYFGFNTGRIKIIDNEFLQQKNPFFAPKFGLQPKIKFGPIALTFIFEYDYDISKSSWRNISNAKSNQTSINKLRQTSLTGQVGLGYVFK